MTIRGKRGEAMTRSARPGVVEEVVEPRGRLLDAAHRVEQALRVERDHPRVDRAAALGEAGGGRRVERRPGAVVVAVLDVAAVGRGLLIKDVAPVAGAAHE